MSAGPGCDAAGGFGPKLRLFVSAVNPCAKQLGGFRDPEITLVLGTIVVPLLKLAWVEQQSPQRIHSAVFQLCDRLTTLSAAIAVAGPPGEVNTTESVVPEALPVSVVP
jgi:hypothetical protein